MVKVSEPSEREVAEQVVVWPVECATEGCDSPASIYFVCGGIGSYYCASCYLKVQVIPHSPTEQAVTEEMVEVASKAVVAEWQKMVAETSPHMSPGDHARAFVSPGNYRLIRAALRAAMEAGR